MSQPRGKDDIATCANCKGTAPRRGGSGFPVGWYGLTVAVPGWFTNDGQESPYQWVGQFCGAACLIAYGPEIVRMENLARQGYDAVVPRPAVPLTSGGSTPGRREPRP